MTITASNLKGKRGLPRLLSACANTRDGLVAVWKTEEAFRQETVLLAAGSVLAMAMPIPLTHKIALIASIMLVMIVELLNSAIEAVVDRISLDIHPLSKAAKDIGSAAVGVAMLLMAGVWGCCLFLAFR